MTRATVTRKTRDGSTVQRPTVRLVDSSEGPLVLELEDKALRLRPKGCKRGGPSEFTITWGTVYREAVLRDLAAKAAAKRKARRQRRGDK